MQPIPEPGVGDGPPHAEQAEKGVPHSASDIIVEWMWGDAGTALTRPLAQMNPLRWHSGSLQAVAADLQGSRSGKEVRRPVDVRVKTGAARCTASKVRRQPSPGSRSSHPQARGASRQGQSGRG